MIYEHDVFKSVLQITENKDIVVIGVDGLGGAGKSTIYTTEIICENAVNCIDNLLETT